jgi:hypothetical protein
VPQPGVRCIWLFYGPLRASAWTDLDTSESVDESDELRQVVPGRVRWRTQFFWGEFRSIHPESGIAKRFRARGIPSRMSYEQDLLAPEPEGLGSEPVSEVRAGTTSGHGGSSRNVSMSVSRLLESSSSFSLLAANVRPASPARNPRSAERRFVARRIRTAGGATRP